jgi:hypothetical protein
MAIDKVTGKRKKLVKTEPEKKEEKKKKALPKFDTKYEEELIKQLFEEDIKRKEAIISDDDIGKLEYSGPFVHHERPGEDWDVPITEEIKYFDPELSYELTGYRPLTMEKGLDFNPEPFKEMAILFETTGTYTRFPRGSKPHRDL